LNTTSSLRRLVAVAALSTALLGAGGCGFFNTLRAKDTLNNGVREFNKGHYEDAEKLFQQALEYDPSNANARLFYAMTLNAKMKRNPTEQLGLQTVDAYKAVLDSNPSKDQADKVQAFIADVYKAVADAPDVDDAKIAKYREARREWLLKRSQTSDSQQTKAQMLYAVGQSYWEEANNLVKSFEKRDPDPTKPATYDMPLDKHDEAMKLIGQAHDYLNQALATDPNYADAYAYQKILYTLEAKITIDKDKVADLNKKALEAGEQFRTISSANASDQAGSDTDTNANTNAAGQ